MGVHKTFSGRYSFELPARWVGVPPQTELFKRTGPGEQTVVASLAVTLKGSLAPAAVKVVARPVDHRSRQTMRRLEAIAREMNDLDPDEELLRNLVRAALPAIRPADPNVSIEAAMLLRARRMLLESGDWITAAKIAELAGWNTTNPSTLPNRWKRAGRIFAVTHQGVDYFPLYGLDQTTWQPLVPMAEVVGALRSDRDDWGMAYWLGSVNGYLAGRRPQDMIASDPEAVLRAARAEVDKQLHPVG